jgi:hypothetical protein
MPLGYKNMTRRKRASNTFALPRSPKQKCLVLLILPLLIVSSACTVRLVGEYDEVIDHSLTEFQQKTEAFLSHLEAEHGNPGASYAKNVDFYNDAQASISTMRVRAAAQPKKEILVQQLDLLKRSMEDLRKLHQSAGADGLGDGAIEAARSALEVHLEAILKLELALKRGKKSARMLPAPPELTTANGN